MEGETVWVRGTAAYTTSQECGVTAGGVTYCYPGKYVAGTPGYNYQKRGYIGRDSIVRIFSEQENNSIKRGTFERPPKSTLFNAEWTYRQYRDQAKGKWPSLVSLYEDRARRFEKIMGQRGAASLSARATAARTYGRLAALYGEEGDLEQANEAQQRSSDLSTRR